MKAVIMAGGFGTRLRPLTTHIPKPMVPLMNKPMMHHIVDLLKRHGITDLISSLFYFPDAITSYFGDGSRFGVSMSYIHADSDYGTAGSVRNAVNGLHERIMVISGDVLTDFNLTEAIRFHEEHRAKATIVLTHAKNPLQFGVVITDHGGKITRFLEKPSWGEVFSDTINTGIYILEPEPIELIPYRESFDFGKDLFPLLLRQDAGLYGCVVDGYWRDIGNLNEYQEAHLDILNGFVSVDVPGRECEGATIGDRTVLDRGKTRLSGRVVIGAQCTIGEGARLSNTVIGDNCTIGSGASVTNSVLWNDVSVGQFCELSSDVVCARTSIGDRAVIADNVFIADACWIGRGARLSANIKLWPEKVVEEGAVLTRSLVWEDKWLRELFADSRVTGLSNIEMNPEFGAKLGAAYGAFIGTGKSVAVSRDSDNVSRMMNRALICGLLSAGVNTVDLRATSIPLVRHELSTGKEAGGLHVRRSPTDKTMTDIIFFDANGRDLPSRRTKNVERLFFGEDFARAPREQVGGIFFPERTTEAYKERFLSSLNIDAISRGEFRIAIDYQNGISSTIFPMILGSLNCQVVALNAHLDPKKLTRDRSEYEYSLQQLTHIVTSLQYDLGCLIDVGGEKVTIINEKGVAIPSDRLLALVAELFLRTHPDAKTVAVPISSSGEVDVLARLRGVDVMKTRDSHLAMMEAASTKGVRFVGGTKGGFIFPDFFFATDAMYTVAKVLEMIATAGINFGGLDADVPRLSRISRAVNCSWEYKGRVMRKIMSASETQRRDLVDGVKIHFDDAGPALSVFLVPDRERPLFHVDAEAGDPETATRLADEYERHIIQWRDEP
jgi:mannose-1-phosphate guanylyltransferase/phosphomannomutase